MTNVNNKKHILHIAYGLDIGGLERVMINCINGLSEYEHTIIVLTDYSEKFASLLPKNIPIIALNKPQGHDWGIYKTIYKTLKIMQPDIVHTYNLATLEYQVMAFFAGVKFRMHAEHGRDVSDPDGSNKKYQWLRRLVSPFVHKFVSVSKDLHEWLQHTVKLSSSKVTLIYNGINTTTYAPRQEKVVLHDLQKNKFVVGTVGRLAEIKDQKMLIRAFHYACQQDETFNQNGQLSIIGDGGEMPGLKQLINTLELNDRVWMAGARHDMADVYLSIDLFALSSLGEGVPMTILEAMASGKPILSTAVGGVPEVVENEVTGYLVYSHDHKIYGQAMLKAYYNSKALGLAARETACQKFSEETMLQAYKNEYKRGCP